MQNRLTFFLVSLSLYVGCTSFDPIGDWTKGAPPSLSAGAENILEAFGTADRTLLELMSDDSPELTERQIRVIERSFQKVEEVVRFSFYKVGGRNRFARTKLTISRSGPRIKTTCLSQNENLIEIPLWSIQGLAATVFAMESVKAYRENGNEVSISDVTYEKFLADAMQIDPQALTYAFIRAATLLIAHESHHSWTSCTDNEADADHFAAMVDLELFTLKKNRSIASGFFSGLEAGMSEMFSSCSPHYYLKANPYKAQLRDQVVPNPSSLLNYSLLMTRVTQITVSDGNTEPSTDDLNQSAERMNARNDEIGKRYGEDLIRDETEIWYAPDTSNLTKIMRAIPDCVPYDEYDFVSKIREKHKNNCVNVVKPRFYTRCSGYRGERRTKCISTELAAAGFGDRCMLGESEVGRSSVSDECVGRLSKYALGAFREFESENPFQLISSEKQECGFWSGQYFTLEQFSQSCRAGLASHSNDENLKEACEKLSIPSTKFYDRTKKVEEYLRSGRIRSWEKEKWIRYFEVRDESNKNNEISKGVSQ